MSIPEALGGLPAVTAGMLARRGIVTEEAATCFLDPGACGPVDPYALPDLDRAVERLMEARASRQSVCIWGDFDVDGQTSTALLVQALGRAGWQVGYYIPLRLTAGHGLNREGLDEVAGWAQVIVTCDCGVTDTEEIAYAQALGLSVVVTDHHALPDELPAADAIVNPQRLPSDHALHPLCGVGAAYQLVRALYRALDLPEPTDLLDLVALGTIADVASLTGENRRLVQRGLPMLLQGRRPGLRALIETSGIEPPDLPAARYAAFTVAPRLNAVGRLASAAEAVELLLARDRATANQRAARFELLNDERKALTQRITLEAKGQAESQADRPAIVVAAQNWHPGVSGLVASRLAEQFARPVAVIDVTDGIGTASVRSVPGINVQAALVHCANHLRRHGGHEMAAGFEIDIEKLDAFHASFDAAVAAQRLEGEPTDSGTSLEDTVQLGELSLGWLRDVYLCAPFGQGHPMPVWQARGVRLVNVKGIGAGGAHSRLQVEDTLGHRQTALWWRTRPEEVPGGAVDIEFTAEPNVYRGETSLQLVIRAARRHAFVPQPAHQPEGEEPSSRSPTIRTDHRNAPNRYALLSDLRARSDIAVFAEAEIPPGGGASRTSIQPAETLVFWSTPPAPSVIAEVIERVQPREVVVLTANEAPGFGSLWERMLKRLVPALQRARNRAEGRIALAELAGETGDTVRTVRAALQVLHDANLIRYTISRDTLAFSKPDAPMRKPKRSPALDHALEETAAFRRYAQRADLDGLYRLGG
ncbi:MAG: single-stranded-DNA-specific exonuclease RecJ [Bacteroidota bacterium]